MSNLRLFASPVGGTFPILWSNARKPDAGAAAQSRECIAIVTIGAGVGGGGMTRDQMIDRERVFDCEQTDPCLLSPLHDVGPRAYNATVTECDRQIGARMTFAVGTIGVASGIAFCKSQTSAGIRDRTALRELRSGYKVAGVPPRAFDHPPTRTAPRCENSA